MTRLWKLEAAFLLFGSLCLGWYVWNFAASEVDASWSNYQLDATIRGDNPSLSGYIGQLVKPGGGTSGEPEKRPTSPEPHPAVGATLGRIEIPRLKLSVIVREGVDDGTLRRAAGHVPHTSLPGQGGNVGIAAHRDTHFRNLRGVQIGDTVRLITPQGVHQYRVASTRIVLPRNVEVLDPTPEPTLTLVTCYPFNYVGSAPKRFIVQAKQITTTATVQSSGAGGM